MKQLLTLLTLLGIVPFLQAADNPKTVELLEDDCAKLILELKNDGADFGGSEASTEETNPFTGKACLKVTAPQRFSPEIKGWSYQIKKDPKGINEYRYMRFAWRKAETTNFIALQIAMGPKAGNPTLWEHRYHCGDGIPWASKQVAKVPPTEWRVETMDMFTDWGEQEIKGMAFTPYNGGTAYFDHIYLGKSIEDLDEITLKMLKDKPVKFTDDQLKQLWEELALMSTSDNLRWQVIRSGESGLKYLSEQAKTFKFDKSPANEKLVDELLPKLLSPRFVVRDAARKQLAPRNMATVELLRAKAEKQVGAERELLWETAHGLQLSLGVDFNRQKNLVTILEKLDSAEAKTLLKVVKEGIPEPKK